MASGSRSGFVRLPKSAFAQLEVDCSSSSSTRSELLGSSKLPLRTDTWEADLDTLGEAAEAASLVSARLGIDIARVRQRRAGASISCLLVYIRDDMSLAMGPCGPLSERQANLDTWSDAPISGNGAINLGSRDQAVRFPQGAFLPRIMMVPSHRACWALHLYGVPNALPATPSTHWESSGMT